MPAKKAPSATETSNSLAEPKATPSASATAASVKSSRDWVRTTPLRIHGKTRTPTMSIRATNSATLPSVTPSVRHRCSGSALTPGGGSPPSTPASAGSSTSASTVIRSSTTSQPTAMRPSSVASVPRCSSARSSTTVLATESARPKMTPAPKGHPQKCAAPMPSAVATAICASAPGIAMPRTAMRSRSEKCVPTPNMSSITPISASCGARWLSATQPGVYGPRAMPATR